ncbi:hypothetical protein RTG_03165 [Rhodotorula toruloides ATCC 204091]|uniref:Proteophosphoglycan ppg4 n=1 Tax=Rhodotorula toruloides TaxID=5286 RepID=A0A0K3CU12_RHOTO|nr:hypothetical protein RTG_03165 [Rhodotorula toruloides ATCC 204091]KAK4330668.1 hypothetical protein RTBOTA2_006332 [Rhodotorula toruloides]
MAPILPLELQLHVLELALPPLIRRNLDERVRLCKAFSLVHRSWTRTAQRELHEHLSIFYDEPARVDTVAQERIAAAKEGGWRFKRVDIELDTGIFNAGILEGYVLDNEQWRLQRDPADFGDLDEMWISMAFADFESFGATSLRRLHIFDRHVRETAAMLYHLPPRLTYLAFHNGGFPTYWNSNILVNLTTLVLEDIEECSWDILPRKTSLRVLCLKSRHPAFETDALERMPFLEHIAVAAVDTKALEEYFSRGERLSLPPTLKRFTLVSSEELPAEELNDWDPEEWAYSVGA